MDSFNDISLSHITHACSEMLYTYIALVTTITRVLQVEMLEQKMISNQLQHDDKRTSETVLPRVGSIIMN
jgi:hypothetical protein